MNYGSLLPLVLLAVLFYMMMRSSKRRQRQATQVADSLHPGAEVITTAGMLATVHAVDDKHVELEIAPGVVVRYVKGAVARVVPPEDPDPDPDLDADAGSSTAHDEPTNTTDA